MQKYHFGGCFSFQTLKLLDKIVIFLIFWVQLQPSKQLPAGYAALNGNPLGDYELLAEVAHPPNLRLEDGHVMEVLGLVEPLELQVHRLRLAHVRPNP